MRLLTNRKLKQIEVEAYNKGAAADHRSEERVQARKRADFVAALRREFLRNPLDPAARPVAALIAALDKPKY